MLILWDELKKLQDKYWWEITLLILALILIGAGVFWWKQSSTTSDRVEVLSATDPQPASVASAQLIIDVSGEVESPGVYTLPFGLRVSDAIASAGGLTDESNSDWIEKNLNRAEKLRDGMKIFIPARAEIEATAVNSIPANTKININSATQAELESLTGIGPVTAGKIIAKRPFATIEDMVKQKLVSQKVFDQIKDQISAW